MAKPDFLQSNGHHPDGAQSHDIDAEQYLERGKTLLLKKAQDIIAKYGRTSPLPRIGCNLSISEFDTTADSNGHGFDVLINQESVGNPEKRRERPLALLMDKYGGVTRISLMRINPETGRREAWLDVVDPPHSSHEAQFDTYYYIGLQPIYRIPTTFRRLQDNIGHPDAVVASGFLWNAVNIIHRTIPPSQTPSR